MYAPFTVFVITNGNDLRCNNVLRLVSKHLHMYIAYCMFRDNIEAHYDYPCFMEMLHYTDFTLQLVHLYTKRIQSLAS